MTSIDGASAPFGGAHELSTSATTPDPHNSVVADALKPKTEGVPTLIGVWRHLLGSDPTH